MYEQYPKFVVDSQRARRRLAEAIESAEHRETKQRFSRLSDRTLPTARHKDAGKGDRSIRDFIRSIPRFVHQIWSRTFSGTAPR